MEQAKTSWQGLEEELGSLLGYSSQEMRGMLRMQFPSGATDRQAREYITKKYSLGALNDVNTQRLEWTRNHNEEQPGAISASEWARTPDRRKVREVNSVPYRENEKGVAQHEGKDLSTDFVRIKDERYVADQRASLGASFYARQGSTIGVTAESSKILKRDKLHGHNVVGEYVNIPVNTAQFKAGPGSMGYDQFQVTRSAVVVSGSVTPPGERYVDPRLGPYRERTTKRVSVPIDQPLPSAVDVGTRWGAGQSVSLAAGYTPIRTDPTASYEVLNRRQFRNEATGIHGYEMAIAKTTPLDKANTFGKFGGTKQQDTAMDLSGVRSASTGRFLGLHTLEEAKDWGGIAYQYWQAKGHDYTLEKVNALRKERKLGQLKGFDNYGSLGDQPLEAFHREIEEKKLLQEIYVPKTMTKERYLERLAKTDTTGYAGYKVTDAGEGLVSVREKAWAVVMDKAQQTGRDYDPRMNFLSRNTLRNIQPHNPAFVKEAIARSRSTRRAYKEVVNSMLATAGTHAAPQGAEGIGGMNPQAVLARAAAAARESYGENAPESIPREVLQKHFLDQIKGNTRPMMANTAEGNLYLPSGRSLAHFSAQGARLGEDVSSLTGSTMQLFEAMAAGDPKTLKRAADRYKAAIGSVGAGEKSIIKAKGAFLPDDMMSGMKAKGSDALGANEVYFPELALKDKSNAAHVMGFPEWGDEGKQMWTNVSHARAKELGLNNRNSYISQEIAQGAGRDFDGDNIYALLAGKGAIQRDKNGDWVGPNGKKMATTNEAHALAARAITMGHGDLKGEMEAYQPRMDRAGVLGSIRDKLVPKWLGQNQYVDAIRDQSQLYKDIGPKYNTFTRGLATATDAGRGAMNKLFWYSHGLAQRPEVLPKQLDSIHKLAGAGRSSWYGGGLNGRNKLAALDFGSARGNFAENLAQLKTNKGDAPFLSSGEVADVMLPAGSDRRGGFTAAVDKYRETGKFAPVLAAMGEGHEDITQWVESTDTGRLYSGRAYQRRSKDTSILDTLTQAGFNDDQALRIAASAEQSFEEQRRVVASTQKHRSGSLASRISQAAESADAARGFVRPLAQAQRPQPEAQAQVQSAVQNLSAATSPNIPPPFPDEMGTPAPASAGGGGGGVSSGGGGGGGGGTTPNTPRPWHEVIAGRVNPKMVSTLAYLNENLPLYSDQLTGTERIKKGSELHKTVTRGAELYLNGEEMQRKLHGMQKDDALPQNQRLAAQKLLNDYFDGGRIRGEDLENAFMRFDEMSAEDGSFEILQGIKTRERGYSAKQDAYGRKLGSQLSRKAGHIAGKGAAGRMAMQADTPYADAASLRTMYSEDGGARDLIAQRSGLMEKWHGASGAEQRQLAPQINAVSESMKKLKDEVTPLIEAVKAERVEVREGIKMRQTERTNIQSLMTAKASQLEGVRKNIDKLAGENDPERAGELEGWQKRESRLSRELSRLSSQEKTYSREIGQGMGHLEGLQTPSLAGMRTSGVRAPQSLASRFGHGVSKTLDPQRLFYKSQMLTQGYFMMGRPLMDTRDQYLQSEFSRGRMEYALGMGGTGDEVANLRRQQATVANITEGVGKGVNSVVSPWIQAAGNFAGNNAGSAPAVGAAATYGIAGLGVATAVNMTGAGSLGMWGAKTGWGQLAKNAPELAGGLAVAGGVTAAVAGGLALGAGGYEVLRRTPIGDLTGASDISATQNYRNFRGLAGYAWDVASGEDAKASAQKWGEFAYGKGYNDKPIPVEIVDMRKEIAAMLGGQVSDTQAGDITRTFAEAAGLKEADLAKNSEGRGILGDISNMALKAGIDPEQLAKFIGDSNKAFGVGVGSPKTMELMKLFTDAQSMPELESLMSSASAVSMGAQKAGMFDHVGLITKRYDQIKRDDGEYAAQRYKSGQFLETRYDWSKAAYASGNDNLAMMDENQPWRPRHEREQFDIQDRRRREDLTTSLGAQYSVGVLKSGFGIAGFSGGRQETQIGWQGQQNTLADAQFDFQQVKRDQDYGFNVRQNDLSRRQTLHNIGREEKSAGSSNWYQERQFGINKQLFDLQTGYSLEDFDTRESRMGTQRSWQLEDFSQGRAQFELQTGWQSEDNQRNLRYSTGRQRLEIRRNMERQAVLSNIQRTKMQTNEGRADTQNNWQEDDLSRDRERFDETRPLMREQMMLSKEYWEMQKEMGDEDRETRKGFALEQLQLQDDRHQAWLDNYDTETVMIKDQHTLDLEMRDAKLQWDIDDLERARERAKEDEKMLGWQRELNEAQQIYNAYMELGAETVKGWRGDIKDILEYTRNLAAIDLSAIPVLLKGGAPSAEEGSMSFVPGAGGLGRIPVDGQSSNTGRYMLPSYATGGPISDTGAAVVHKGEYVVPVGGALVQSDGQQALLLSSILSVLTQISSNNGKELVINLDGEKVGDIILGGALNNAYQ